MYPQFDPGTFHYAIGCSDEDTLTLMLSTKDEDTRLSVNETQQSSNQNAEVELTGVSSDSDIAITLSNSDDATTTYVVHCLAADFPVITVTKRPEAWDGLILQSVGPQGENWSYLTIIDNNGVPWFRRRVDARAPHFRVFDDGAYPYAYTQSAGTIPNFRGGTSNNSILVVLDENLEQVQTVETVGLQHTDNHDFFVKRNGNYILLAYEPARRDLSDFTDEDGNAYSTTEGTEDSVIQEVTADGVEVFRWNSWDHMAIEDCTQHRFPWDYAHINSVEDVDGNILASFRGCSAVLMIDGQTGDVIWRLGRSNRSAEDWANTPPAPLTIKDDPYGEFCGQHSAKIIGNGNLLLFDNGTDCVVNPDTGISQRPSGVFSRVVEYSLDLEKGEATFVRHHSLHGTFMLWGRSGGLVSPMDNGNWLVSWGGGKVDKPPDQSVTEVNPGTGEQLLSIKFTYDGGRLATRSYALRQEQLTLGSAPPPPKPPGPGGGGGGGGAPRTSAPEAPRNLMAVGGDGQVVLTWDAPASDGGAAITDYEYRINGRNPWISIGSTNTTHTVTGLVNGAAYTFQVRAVNRIGTGRASTQAEATPEAPGSVYPGLCAFRQWGWHHLRSGVRERGECASPSRSLLLRHRWQSDCRRNGSRYHRRSDGSRGRRADGPDGGGAAGRTHDSDPRARRSGERIGEGDLGCSHRRDAPL